METNFEGLTFFLFQLVFVALVVERAVAQVKNLSRMDWQKPWPAVAVLLSMLAVYAADVNLLPVLTRQELRHGSVAATFDGLLLALWISGGVAGIINTVKNAMRHRDAIHQAKLRGSAP